MMLLLVAVANLASALAAGECTDNDNDHWNVWGPSLCPLSSLPGGDCNKFNPAVHPFANDIPGDGIDQDCDGHDDVDADGDGYTADGDDRRLDCIEILSSVNPGAEEDGVDDLDEDCDGLLVVRRDFLSDASAFPTLEFTFSNVTEDAGRYVIDGSADGWLKVTNPIPFKGGLLTVGVDIDSFMMPATCQLGVKSTSMPAPVTTTLTPGYNEVTFSGAEAGDQVTDLKVECTGAADVFIDWITVQNGRYEWAPMGDIGLSFSTMGYPGGGYQTFVRLSQGYDGDSGLIMMGSDVGGMAWTYPHDPTTDPTEWVTANGLATQWDSDAEYSTSDAFAFVREGESGVDPDDFDVYVLAGGENGGGGLWCTSAIESGADQSWTLVDQALSSNQFRDECVSADGTDDGSDPDAQGTKEFGSGHLIARYPGADEWLVVASNAGSARGVWLVNASECGSVIPPQWDATEHFTGLPDAMPSALAPVTLGGDNWLAVGYRPVMDGSHEDGALYLCEADFVPPEGIPGSGACFPVLEDDTTPIGDVRDIEVFNGSMLLVADGGRTVVVESDDDLICEPEEPTVYLVALTADAGFFTAQIADTDGTHAEPSWDTDGTDTFPYDDCSQAPDPSGNLTPPVPDGWDLAYALSTVAVDPTESWAFTFFPLYQREREYGCVRVFRAAVDDLLAGDEYAWAPFQEYNHGQLNFTDAGSDSARRRDHVDTRGAFMSSEPLPEVWAPGGALDAVFVPRPAMLSGGGDDLLVSASFFWWAFQDDGVVDDAVVGWDSDPAEDLDLAEWALAWGDSTYGAWGVPTLQSMTSISAAVCPGCGTEFAAGEPPDLLLGGGSGDYQYAVLFGAEVPEERRPAQRPCSFNLMLSAARTVSVWYDRSDSEVAPQAWLGLQGQNARGEDGAMHYDDPGFSRGILFSDGDLIDGTNIESGSTPGELGLDWCADVAWNDDPEALVDPALTTWRYQSAATDWQIRCQDEQLGVFYANDYIAPCSTEEDEEFRMLSPTPIGTPRQIVAIGPDTALMLTTGARDDMSDTEAEPGTEGLWVVTYTPDFGLSYEKVELDTNVACTDFYMYTAGGELDAANHLSVHSDTSVAAGYVRAFVTSQTAGCGVYEVTFEIGDADASRIWSEVPLDVGDCSLNVESVRGTTPRADGHHLLVWGESGALGPNDICDVDLDKSPLEAKSVLASTADVQGTIEVLIPHPHVDDVFYYGLWHGASCATCPESGVWGLQRRVMPGGTEIWTNLVLSEGDLEMRTVRDLDLGPGVGERDDPIRRLYVTAQGSGFWEGTPSW